MRFFNLVCCFIIVTFLRDEVPFTPSGARAHIAVGWLESRIPGWLFGETQHATIWWFTTRSNGDSNRFIRKSIGILLLLHIFIVLNGRRIIDDIIPKCSKQIQANLIQETLMIEQI